MRRWLFTKLLIAAHYCGLTNFSNQEFEDIRRKLCP